jgi:DNA polymerase-3 subunit delta
VEFNDILADLKKKVYKPVYFLMGEEPYFIDRISNYIEHQVLDESEKEFNQTVLYGQDVDILSIISEAKRFPMMGTHTVVIIKEAQHIRNLTKDDEKSKNKSPLLTYIENPQPSTILVFCYKYKTLDKRTALAKAMAKHAVLFESKKIYENRIPDWIGVYLKAKKYAISPKAAALLTEYLGADLGKISNELEKLMINLPAGSEITPEHIQKYIGISKDYNVFELQNALGKKDVLRANRIAAYFSANKRDNPLVLTVPTLFSYFNKILAVHFLKDRSKDGVARELKINPFFASDYVTAAKNYSAGKVVQVISELRETDLRSKGIGNTSADEGELLKELVYKILH